MKTKLTKRVIDAAKPRDTRYVIWDSDTPGFGVRVNKDGSRTFVLKYFFQGRQRWLTLAKYGALTVEQARKAAIQALGGKASGEDAVEKKHRAQADAMARSITLAEFCDDYMEDARNGLVLYRGVPKKSSTLDSDQGRVERHLKPLLGRKLVADITPDDVANFMDAVRLGKTAATIKSKPRGVARVRGGTTAANRAVGLLGSIMSYAVRMKRRADNPVRGIEKAKDGRRERAISPDEYRRLGSALDQCLEDGANPWSVHAIHVIALSGCRKSEVFALRKAEVDTHNRCFRFSDTKSGQQLRSIGRATLDVVIETPEMEESDYVFPASRGDGPLRDVKVFHKACAIAGLSDVTIHSLRHGFASVAGELGYSDATIGVLLGHHSNTITGRYTHIPDPAAAAAADRVAAAIARRMNGETEGAEVVELSHAKGS